ncbi:MAG TPA: glycosyltransferase family 9 protein [Candidatus Eremiobacteraeota bacterium]|nr:MAG: lipopolysaccharide core biosynthesis protein [bacterium ADurb.Bin363]HPZ07925.1 glycosyltransferase family 9 protein [Candidatus Eremiobacteraeota bacterium]
MLLNYKPDCKFFIGEKPCKYKRLCQNCEWYSPFKFKILIIKLAATGDVLRTTPLLRGIKRHYPESHITWLTDSNALEILQNNSFIDRILTFNLENILRLQVEEFDLLYSLDKEIRATALAETVKAKVKKGFAFHKIGNIYPLNKESHYAFMLGLSDDLKFNINQKSYQEIIFELCCLNYERDEYILNLLPEELEEGKRYLYALGVRENNIVIGLNTGAGRIYATKKWSPEGFIQLANKLNNMANTKILLLGGEEERERNSIIKKEVEFDIIDTGTDNSIKKFTSIIGNCNLIVTGDTLALHLAIATKVPVVAFFGPTCHQEIELYGRGVKLIANDGCPPCYRSECMRKPSCLDKMSSEQVYKAILKVLASSGRIIEQE